MPVVVLLGGPVAVRQLATTEETNVKHVARTVMLLSGPVAHGALTTTEGAGIEHIEVAPARNCKTSCQGSHAFQPPGVR